MNNALLLTVTFKYLAASPGSGCGFAARITGFAAMLAMLAWIGQ